VALIQRATRNSGFTGLILLKPGNRYPRSYEDLEFINKEKNYIGFFEWGGKRHTVGPTEENVQQSQKSAGEFVPTITWSVKMVQPGTIGRRPFDTPKEAKPHVRETFRDPESTYIRGTTAEEATRMLAKGFYETGNQVVTGSYDAISREEGHPNASTHTITVYGQWFDNIVQYDCWSTSNQEANSLILWFEDFMDLYTRVLKENGVQELLYWQRLEDKVVESWRDDIDNRTIQYYFRTEKLRVEKTRNFRSYYIYLRVAHRGEMLLHGEPSGITTQTGLFGLNAWNAPFNNPPTSTGEWFTGDGSYPWGTLELQDLGFEER